MSMRMRIKQKVIDCYTQLCPISTSKCRSVSEIKYKIERAVRLGKVIKYKVNGMHVVQYYNRCFIIDKDKVVGMFKTQDKFHVSLKLKYEYDRAYMKILV